LRPVEPGSPLILEELEQWKPQGVLVDAGQTRVIGWCKQKGVPYVALLAGKGEARRHAMSAGLDDPEVGQAAARYFIQRGYKVFAFVGNGNYSFSLERQKGFKNTLRSEGMEAFDFVHSTPEFDPQPKPRLLYHMAMGEWLEGLPKPVGVFAANDWEALAVAQACSEAGLRVPGEVSILGAGDDPLLCRLSATEISSIKLPFAWVGQDSSEQLLARLSGRCQPAMHRRKHLAIIPRRSSDEFGVPDSTVRQALDYMAANIAQPFKIAALISHLGVSRPSIERYFRAVFGRGETPLVILRRLRMEKAKQLLADGSLSNAEIAARTGFSSNIRFVTVFKQHRDGDNFQSVRGDYRQQGALVRTLNASICGTGHRCGIWPVNVCVKQAHLRPLRCKRPGQVHCHGGFSYSTLAAHHDQLVPNLGAAPLYRILLLLLLLLTVLHISLLIRRGHCQSPLPFTFVTRPRYASRSCSRRSHALRIPWATGLSLYSTSGTSLTIASVTVSS